MDFFLLLNDSAVCIESFVKCLSSRVCNTTKQHVTTVCNTIMNHKSGTFSSLNIANNHALEQEEVI